MSAMRLDPTVWMPLKFDAWSPFRRQFSMRRTYQFSVLASNNDDVWGNEATTIQITILPTFVETIWFKLICAAALGSR
jgi:hypothetical protein